MKAEVHHRKIRIDQKLLGAEPDEIRKQIQQYQNGERKEFNIQIGFPEGFTGKVLKQINMIEYGETRTYGQIAEKIDSSAIAVGQACSRNPVPVIVPCHRVIGSNGIGGYIYGKNLKKQLLEFEKSQASE